MPADPVIRPMREEDAEAAIGLSVETFEDLSRRQGREPEPPPEPARVLPRYVDLLRSDPAGAWVAVQDGDLVACAMAIMREGVWGLSLLIVRPDRQSSGLGSAVLARAHGYANGARGRIILASADPRALRAYARLGLTPHPCLQATGTPRGVAAPNGVREGTPDDIPFTEEVDRIVRSAAHGADIATFLAMENTLLILPGRGYAVVRGAELRLLAGVDAAGAQDVLRAVLARADGEITVEWLTAAQHWAIPVCLDAGLALRPDDGVVFLGGDLGPFSPYLPSGAFL